MVISMSDTAASGGYYMAMTGDPIVAYPATLTGSIGVVFGKAESARIVRQAGHHQGRHSARQERGDRFRLHGADAGRARRCCKRGSTRAIGILSPRWRTRGTASSTEIEPVAQGRVWLGSQAKLRGLVDETGGLDKAIEMVKQKAKIPAARARQPDDLSGAAQFVGPAHEEVAGGHDGGKSGPGAGAHAFSCVAAGRIFAHDALLGGGAVGGDYDRQTRAG